MVVKSKVMFSAAVACFLIALFHLLVMMIGAPMYHFIDASELANLSLRGSGVPSILMFVLSLIFSIFGFYALSACDMLIRLPKTRFMVVFIGVLFLLRGSFVFLFITLYLTQSAIQNLNEVFFSLIALFIGCLFIIGAKRLNML